MPCKSYEMQPTFGQQLINDEQLITMITKPEKGAWNGRLSPKKIGLSPSRFVHPHEGMCIRFASIKF